MTQPPDRRDAALVVVKNSIPRKPFVVDVVENHLCAGIGDAENEGSVEAPLFDLVVDRPEVLCDLKDCPGDFKACSLTDPVEQGPFPAVRISGKSQIQQCFAYLIDTYSGRLRRPGWQ